MPQRNRVGQFRGRVFLRSSRYKEQWRVYMRVAHEKLKEGASWLA